LTIRNQKEIEIEKERKGNSMTTIPNEQTGKKQVLSEEVKRRIEATRKDIEKLSSEAYKFLKFADGQHRLLLFDKDRIPEKSVIITFATQPTEPVARYVFFAWELTEQDKDNELKPTMAVEEAKEWTVSPTVANELLRWIAKGYFLLDVTRHGTEFKTRYEIEPHID
jgi:hypothetical protein